VNATIRDLATYIDRSPSPFHAVQSARAKLEPLGFVRIDERESWESLAPGKYWVTSGDSNMLAFHFPDKPRALRLVGAHTDSPNLRLKPRAFYQQEGFYQTGVEVYGGALLNSWLDRDLGLAGRVLLRERDGSVGSRLVHLAKPLFRVPQLAIHLDREVNEKGLVLNRQEHLVPIFGLADAPGPSSDKRDALDQLAAMLADEAKLGDAEILAWDLMLFDVQASALGGRQNEFLFAARLDNLAMCHAATCALAEAIAEPGESIAMIALFDHEEVGSETMHGAASAFLPRVLSRLVPNPEAFHRMCAASSCISADMAHAVHPNYASRHEPRHKPRLNGGPVIKVNAQQRYATDAKTAAMFADLCARVDVPVQHYAHRTDLPCGSTIGPIASTRLGIATVDVGNPMLSMHSAREMCGSTDQEKMIRVFAKFLTT
jgi:aspartyl aminopeptidase